MARTVTLPILAHSSSSCWWYFLANLMNSRLPTSSPNLSRFWLTRGLILTDGEGSMGMGVGEMGKGSMGMGVGEMGKGSMRMGLGEMGKGSMQMESGGWGGGV